MCRRRVSLGTPSPFFCMSTKPTNSEATPAAAPQPATTREALHRRVKQAQERRRQKLKHVNP